MGKEGPSSSQLPRCLPNSVTPSCITPSFLPVASHHGTLSTKLLTLGPRASRPPDDPACISCISSDYQHCPTDVHLLGPDACQAHSSLSVFVLVALAVWNVLPYFYLRDAFLNHLVWSRLPHPCPSRWLVAILCIIFSSCYSVLTGFVIVLGLFGFPFVKYKLSGKD